MRYMKQFKKDFDNHINMIECLDEVLARMEFNEKSKNSIMLKFNKSKLAIVSFICLFFIAISSISTYFITKANNPDKFIKEEVFADTYIKIAQEYISMNYEVMIEKPKSTYYINNYNVLNIYEIKVSDNSADKYFWQIFSLTNYFDFEIEVKVSNDIGQRKSLIKSSMKQHEIGLLNDDFQITNSYLFGDIFIDNKSHSMIVINL